MDLWTFLRLFKFVGVVLLGAGVALATVSGPPEKRALAGWGLVPAGVMLTWITGYGLLKSLGLSVGAPWVSLSMLGSLVMMVGAIGAAERGGRGWALLTWGGLGAALGGVVGRESSFLAASLIGAVSCVVAVWSWVPASAEALPHAGRAPRAFWWWTRAEALSAAMLMLVYMPLKYGFNIVLDGGQGWVGWVHGVLTVIFLSQLPWAARAARWPITEMILAFIAALVPLGGFWFERRHRRA